MKANLHARGKEFDGDPGVSPVIAVILMVAITVVLAATVYVWVSGFGSEDSGQEDASVRATGYDSDGNGANDFIRLTLVRGENAPYGVAALDFNVTDPDNDVLAHRPGGTDGEVLCVTPAAEGGTAAGYDAECDGTDGDPFDGDDTWSTGAALYVPCQGSGSHLLSVVVRSSLILDTTVRCDEVAPTS